ncbi:MAG: HAD-IIB family hydrolase [Clostridiales bacterium]|nr:HAD-IIB family hydrolase [Clostridiales bacterium]
MPKGKFNKVLIASDFDGTLKNDAGEISKANRDAIAYFISRGGYFTVSTGRTYQGFHLYDPSYINAPVLLANGALAFDYAKGKIVFFDGLGQEAFAALRGVRDNFPMASIEMYPFDKTFAINLTDDSHRHFTSQNIEYSVVDDPSQADCPWQKVMIGSDRESSPKIQAYLKSLGDDPSFLPTTGSFIEVLKEGVDKGTGLLKLADCLAVPHSRAYAVGDGYNDLEMLQAAAAAFVPANADNFAKAAATHMVASNNEHALKQVIEILDQIYE